MTPGRRGRDTSPLGADGSHARDLGANKAPLAMFGWPAILTLRLASAYTDRSPWTLRRAVADGQLRAAGRCGRVPTFRREDLDAYLIGGHVADQVRAADRDAKPLNVRQAAPAADDLARARLRQLAKGGAR